MRDAIGEQSIGCPRRRQSLATPTLQSERRLYVVVISPHLAHRARGDRHGDRRHHLPERLIGSLPFDVSLARDARKAKRPLKDQLADASCECHQRNQPASITVRA